MPKFLLGSLAASLPSRRKTQVGLLLLLQHNAFLFHNSFTSATLYESNHQNQQQQQGNGSFTLSYLMNSCGLSPKVAVEVSKKVKLKDPDGPDSMLNLLRNYGFSKTQISELVMKAPTVLSGKSEKTFLPKFMFLRSIGFSCADIPNLLIRNPALLFRSLERCIIPRYEVLKGVLLEDEKVLLTIKRGREYFLFHEVTNLVPNMNVLREYGAPQSSISLLVKCYTSVAFIKHEKFVECVKLTKETGFDPLKTTFITALCVFVRINKLLWESKLLLYERWGLSRDVTLSTFKRYPQFMMISEEKMTKSFEFLVHKMGWSPIDIAVSPGVLSCSLKLRVIPRCSVAKILEMKGLIQKRPSLGTLMSMPEEAFLERFVIRYQENVPLLLEVYKGQIDPLHAVRMLQGG